MINLQTYSTQFPEYRRVLYTNFEKDVPLKEKRKLCRISTAVSRAERHSVGKKNNKICFLIQPLSIQIEYRKQLIQ